MGVQVLSLMWLHTTTNYQYRRGSSMGVAFRTLYQEGGLRRFYRGVSFAVVQAPLARFADTGANTGVMAFLSQNPSTSMWPMAAKTFVGTVVAASFRVVLMPIDTAKTILQVEGQKGLTILRSKVAAGGLRVLYHGSMASLSANMTVHFMWFYTHNLLNDALPKPLSSWETLSRNATIGFCSSAVSDICANALRVIKVAKQTSALPVTYSHAMSSILASEGVWGVATRGLPTRLLSNGVQGVMFTVLWKAFEPYFLDIWTKR